MRVLPILASLLMLSGGFLARPQQAEALGKCSCESGPCRCFYNAASSAFCRCEGSLCVSGGGGTECKPGDALAPRDIDGTFSAPTRLATTGGAKLEHRPCNGAVVARSYSEAIAVDMRSSTQNILV